MYLMEKRDGKIKNRGCADRTPQQGYTKQIDTSSPTASMAAMIFTCMIDSSEQRGVATVNIPQKAPNR